MLYEIFNSQKWLHVFVPERCSARKFEAGNFVPLADGNCLRFAAFANFHSCGAPRLKSAALRVQGKVWGISWDYVHLGFARALAFSEMRRQASQ
jgi:hypothetical protein